MSCLRQCTSKFGMPNDDVEHGRQNTPIDENTPYTESTIIEGNISSLREFENKNVPSKKKAESSGKRDHEKPWFSKMMSRTSSIMRKSSRKAYVEPKCQTANKGNEISPFLGQDISVLDDIRNTFLIKANIVNMKNNFVNYQIQLGKVSVCKECDILFDDTDQIVYTLMKTKVQCIIPEDSDKIERYNCMICRANISDEEALRKHLLKHIESNEIVCEDCEEVAREGTSENIDPEIVRRDKKLEKVYLLQVIASCNLCNRIMLGISAVLPEVMTIEHYDKKSERSIYKCYECGSKLASSSKDEEKNIILIQKPLCEKCKDDNAYNHFVMVGMEKARTSWASTDKESPISEMYPTRHPPPRRHIFIKDANKPIDIKLMDFVIEDTYSDIGHVCLTCRFCGYSTYDEAEMENHVSSHISLTNSVCEECETDITWG